MTRPMRLQTLAVHGGEEPQNHLGALSTPLYHASSMPYLPRPKAPTSAKVGGRATFYGRIGNPTQAAAEAAVAALEGGEAALLTSSGMAALSATLFSLLRAGDHERGRQMIDALRVRARAVSLGDVATLVQHSATMTHASVPTEQRLAAGITDGLLRISVGIETVEDLIADLDGALGAALQGGTL